MTPQQQRIAIAEFCGWIYPFPASCMGYMHPPGRKPQLDPVPDYLNDLNAMHEAEKSIQQHLRGRYANTVAMVVGNSVLGDYDSMHSITATAQQRAEAFLRTIGKWEES